MKIRNVGVAVSVVLLMTALLIVGVFASFWVMLQIAYRG